MRFASSSMPMVVQRCALACALVISAVGACYSPEPRPGAPCDDDSRCPTGQRCIDGYCGGQSGGGDALTDSPDTPHDAAIDAPPDAPPAGSCVVPGDCPNTNPCRTVACIDNACVTSVRPDGESCGAAASKRCCGGACVDIASDEAHCGGCGQACAPGRDCESVSITNSCGSAPPSTSGRCACAGATAECPDSQVCRTSTPFANRCTPNDSASCAPGQTYVEVSFCPNYCRYP